MSSKRNVATKSSDVLKPVVIVDPNECPFREFRDNELQTEAWGMGTATFRAFTLSKGQNFPKIPPDYIWTDEQIQPMPRSVRQKLSRYERAEELSLKKWNIEVSVCDDSDASMSIPEIQLTYAKFIRSSSFCRKVLSICFILEKAENFVMEHQWEGFNCALGPEGWRAKLHIYSPGIKPGGGPQHKPTLSKNGCYLVRLYYMGAWRCVWVSDLVPVDASGDPLLLFAPTATRAALSKLMATTKGPPPTSNAPAVYLWPLLICKALLKLAAPDMNDNNETLDGLEDEEMEKFSILHALTGGLDMNYRSEDPEYIWNVLTKDVAVFSWDEDDETLTSTMRTKSTKKPTARDVITLSKKPVIACLYLNDTSKWPPYHLPGITPAFDMYLLVTMVRDIPLKKPLPEPEVELWKYYRWVDWARRHGLYDIYECPRSKYLKVNGLLKLSHAMHLLDVGSTESITFGFIKQEGSVHAVKRTKDMKITPSAIDAIATAKMKEELREWMLYEPLFKVLRSTSIVFYPSLYNLTSTTNWPNVRITKTPIGRNIDILAPKTVPLYLQIDGPENSLMHMSLSMVHPRVMANAGVMILEHIESAYVVLECFEWFKDTDLVKAKGFIRTSEYDAIEVTFPPGRHFCRLWIHARMNFHIMLISDSDLVLGPKDFVMAAATRECPWASKFLLNLGSSFQIWLKNTRSSTGINCLSAVDKEFFKAYLPDLNWDNEVVGYDRSLVHWMFRQALQVHLHKRLGFQEKEMVFSVLRRLFRDPDFGHMPKPKPLPYSLRAIVESEPCDCLMPEIEEFELADEIFEEMREVEEKELVHPEVMAKLLIPPVSPITSNICDLATEELPCGLLKIEREKMVKKHEAATLIQANWRGTWARKCLRGIGLTPVDVIKIIQETTTGSQENLSALMNVFFKLYPGAKYAYSVSSALSGVYGIQQYQDTCPITPSCKWIPYFQEIFICHAPCKAHFDLNSSIQNCNVAIYNCDTGQQLPQVYSAHKTFDLAPNINGYTVMGHGYLNEPLGYNGEANWNLTVLTSEIGAIHICTNEPQCTENPLLPATKFHIDELFIPNRRNILGGLQIWVSQRDSICFRAESTSPDLLMVATLRATSRTGEIVEEGTCSGIGEIYWPYIQLQPFQKPSTPLISSRSLKSLKATRERQKSSQSTAKADLMRQRSWTNLNAVVAPEGWPLTIAQWSRVDEVRNSLETPKVEPTTTSQSAKDKTTSMKQTASKDKSKHYTTQYTMPLPDDAYTVLECSLTAGRGSDVVRDDEQEQQFSQERYAWEKSEPGRNKHGAEIRKQFREEFMEVPIVPEPPTESSIFDEYEMFPEHEQEQEKKLPAQGPSPVTGASDSGIEAVEEEHEEELKFLSMPEALRDKFRPLTYVPLCTKELEEHDRVVITQDMAEAAKNERHARIVAEQERREDLQTYNEVSHLSRQSERCRLTENLFVDPQWSDSVQEKLVEREEAIVTEANLRILSANLKKKQDQAAKPPSKK